MLRLLAIIAAKGTVKRSDILPEWSTYLKKVSKFGTDSTFKDTLRRRLLNLSERRLLEREGHHFTITEEGVLRAEKIVEDPKAAATRTIRQFNDQQRSLLRERLSTLHPKRFEHLVGELLDAMGYQDVEVTKESGDKGVDVVGSVQFGITTVTEVVQVKRHKSNIQRPTVDQLRGALPYHKAIRGTLITLGNFSSGCTDAAIFQGAAPITLINGEKLMDLLFEHEIGVTRTQVPLYELDEEFFADQPEPEEQLEDLPHAPEEGS